MNLVALIRDSALDSNCNDSPIGKREREEALETANRMSIAESEFCVC